MKDLVNDKFQQKDESKTSNPEEIDNSSGHEQTYKITSSGSLLQNDTIEKYDGKIEWRSIYEVILMFSSNEKNFT